MSDESDGTRPRCESPSEASGHQAPRTGDLVRARVDARDGPIVEGVLHLRHVPALGYVQVMVDGNLGYAVDPASIEVIRRGVTPVEQLERTDPLRTDPGWRRIVDLDEAQREGLIRTVARGGGSWAEMFNRLDRVAAPLVDAGWEVSDQDQCRDSKEGDSVSYILARGGTSIELGLDEHGSVYFFPLDEDLTPEDEGYFEDLFNLARASANSIREEYGRRGWL